MTFEQQFFSSEHPKYSKQDIIDRITDIEKNTTDENQKLQLAQIKKDLDVEMGNATSEPEKQKILKRYKEKIESLG